MLNLTAAGAVCVSDISLRYGLSQTAVENMARAVANGGGARAQFNVAELGGSGHWTAGGMTMVGDTSNYGLQIKVSSLCSELSSAMGIVRFFGIDQIETGGGWWPDGLGQPSSSGGQSQARYAYFPNAGRIAYDRGNGHPLILFASGNHQISGFSQKYSDGDPYFGVSVISQLGEVALSAFPQVNASGHCAQLHDGPDPTPLEAVMKGSAAIHTTD